MGRKSKRRRNVALKHNKMGAMGVYHQVFKDSKEASETYKKHGELRVIKNGKTYVYKNSFDFKAGKVLRIED